MSVLIRATAALLLIAACTATAPEVAPVATASATPWPTAAYVTASPTPTPEPTRSPIPPSARPGPTSQAFVLLPLRWADTARLWLVDPHLERTPELIAKWTPPFEVGPWVAHDADRSRVVLSAVAPSGFAALFVLEVRSGAIRSLVEDRTADLIGPVIDARGEVVAYTRRSRTQASVDDGIWVAALAGGAPRRLVPTADSAPQALGWSSDAAWLAFTTSGFPHVAVQQPIHVISADGTRRVDTGLTGGIDWHPTQPRLLVTRSAHPSDSAPMSVVSSYEIPSGAVAPLYRPQDARRWLFRARWSPKGDAFVFLEGGYEGMEAEVVVVRSGAVTRPARGTFITEVLWTSTGEIMLVIGGDDSAVGIRNVTAGRSIPLCLRTDDPVRCS